MKMFLMIVKTDEIKEYCVKEYSNNDRRIRFLDETNTLHNYPEQWVAIQTIKVNQ